MLCRTFHDNAQVAPPPRDIVVTFVDPGDRVRGEDGGREGGEIMRAATYNGNVVSRRVTLLHVTLYDRS